MAFQCEGWISKSSRFNSFSIGFHLNKCNELLSDGLAFIEDLKEMLAREGILTTRTFTRFGNLRTRDGRTTQRMEFSIRARSCAAFKDRIGFSVDSRKNNLLEDAAKVAARPRKCEKDALWFAKPGTLSEDWRIVLPTVLDAELARLYAYLLRYGYLSSNLEQFYITSSSKIVLVDFARIVREKFGLVIPYAMRRGYRSYRCVGCSLKIGRWLNQHGLPSRKSKALVSPIPEWIFLNCKNLAAFETVRDA